MTTIASTGGYVSLRVALAAPEVNLFVQRRAGYHAAMPPNAAIWSLTNRVRGASVGASAGLDR